VPLVRFPHNAVLFVVFVAELCALCVITITAMVTVTGLIYVPHRVILHGGVMAYPRVEPRVCAGAAC
jgi:hypothetical protein